MIGLLTVVFFSSVLFADNVFYAFDTLFKYLPWSSLFPDQEVKNPLITDPVNIGYVHYDYFKSCLKQRILPLWDPTTFCGLPFSAGFVPLYNPVAFIALLLLPVTAAHNVILFVHLAATGVFCHLYLRQIRLSRYASLAGAVAWMFNGWVMVWFEFENTVILAASLPATLYFMERWLATPTRLHCLLMTAAAAVAVSSGFAHGIIIQFLFFAVYLAWRLAGRRNGRFIVQNLGIKSLADLLIALAIGAAVSCGFVAAYLPFLDDPQRASMSLAQLGRETGQLPLAYLLTALFPDFFGSPALNAPVFTPRLPGFQPYNNYNELCIYAGMLTTFLVPVCLCYARRKPDIAFYLICYGATLLMAGGTWLFWPLAKLVPGLGYSTPTRLLYLTGFAAAVLAARGLDIVAAARGPGRYKHVAVFLLPALATVFVYRWAGTEQGMRWATAASPELMQGVLRPLVETFFAGDSPVLLSPLLLATACFLCLLGLAFQNKRKPRAAFMILAIGILAFDLMSFGTRYNTVVPSAMAFPSTPAIERLIQDEAPFRIAAYGPFMWNGFKPFGIQDVGGYHSFFPKRYGQYLHLTQHGQDTPFPDHFSRWVTLRRFGSPLLDLINVKYILVPPGMDLQHPVLSPVYDGEVKIYQNAGAFPRLFFVYESRICRTREEALALLSTATRSDFLRSVIIEATAALLSAPATGDRGAVNPATIRTLFYGDNRVSVETQTEADGFLVWSDTFHPSWQCRIDGQSEPIVRANYIMRAVFVKAGVHRVEFTYEPVGVMAAMALTGAGWLVLAGWIGALVLGPGGRGRRGKPGLRARWFGF